jgi:hypothetical protein
VGLRCARRDAKGLIKGRKLVDVRLELGPDTVIVTDLEVRLTRAYRSFLLGEQLHVGCKYMNMPAETERAIASLLDQINAPQRRR